MHEATSQPDACAICKQPITQQQRPFKRLESGEKAHLACYIDSGRVDSEPLPSVDLPIRIT